ncbi:MAG TPA: hypothetical protein VFB14_26375 [Bryobacteraceae bacterium]|nr:hypothetical protein [Bryobacteraceae bacterium]
MRCTSTALVDTNLQVVEHIQDGRFQRSLCLVAATSSFVSGLEVAYEHYKGSYSNPIMYTPVILSGVVTVTAAGGFFSRRIAETALRWTAATTLADGVIGFGFHIRGIYRKPGGWRLPITNIIMGPPLFAPLLFGTAAYLGFLASYLRREEEPKPDENNDEQYTGWRRDLHNGRFQKHLCVVAAAWTVFSGAEALYSHYKSRFRIWSQWTPIILTPIQLGACIGAIYSERLARTLLPATSALSAADGALGFFYHARGIKRRTGGLKHWVYNILYGPPIFAPLLFSACGALGLLASLLRREKKA